MSIESSAIGNRAPLPTTHVIPGCFRAAIRTAGWPIEAVEVTDAGIYQPEHDVPAIPLPRVATDDSHWESQFGRAWVEVEAARSPDAILRAVKAGDFRLGFAPEAASS